MPSDALSTWTTSHSRPFAECTVREHEPVLVEAAGLREVAGRGRRFEREVGGDVARGRAAWRGGRHERVEVGQRARRRRGSAARRSAAERVAQPLGVRADRGSSVAAPRAATTASAGPRAVGREGALRGGPAHRGRPQAARVEPERLEDAPARVDRSDAIEQLQQRNHASSSRRVVGQPEQGDEVLDVRGLQEAQPAVLHVRDVAAGELELEQVGVVRGAHQHGLLAQRDALARGRRARARRPRRPARPRRGSARAAGARRPGRSARRALR